MDLFFVQGFSFLGFLKYLGFVGYVLLFLHSRYGLLELLEKRIGFREVILNVSNVGAFQRKIRSKKKVICRFWKI